MYSLLRPLLIWGLILLFYTPAGAQVIFKGVLINSIDSTTIPFAAVTIKELEKSLLADEKGAFAVTLPKHTKSLTLHISAIGCKATVTYKYPFKAEQKIYLDITANTLDEFAVKGLTAADVVKIAIASIPANYADSSYFDHSFYRRYQKVNGVIMNLCEASPVVMFRLSKQGKRLFVNEAFAVTQLRRSNFHPDIMNAQEDNPVDLLRVNPVYHLEEGPLNPKRLAGYNFSFDTNTRSNDYVIRFACMNHSTDKHGIGYYDMLDLKGEAWDKGYIVIERGSFAIKKISRTSVRYQDYKYKYFFPQNNLTRYDNKDYFFEFAGGDLEAEYAQRNGKWYLKKMYRQYSQEFYRALFDKEFDITDNFEWYSDSISRYTTKEYADRFFPLMETAIFAYDKAYWQQIDFPFHYYDKDRVYRHLEREAPVETQFYNESKIDEYARKPKRQ